MAITTPETKQQDEFDSTVLAESFKAALSDDATETEESEPEAYSAVYSDFMSPLGMELNAVWDKAERDKMNEVEDRFETDLRQYRGMYDTTTLAKIHPKRSKANLSITRAKVKTITSRMTDVLFPANTEKNWSINASPVPELNPQLLENITQQIYAQTGVMPTPDMVRKGITEAAKVACENMDKEMTDQLSEIKYRDIIRKVLHSGAIYGTGVLKGPLIKTETVKRWIPIEGQWATVEIERRLPYCEFVPVWDIYPDMSAREPEHMRYIFHRHVKTRNEVYELANRDDFNGEAIVAYLRAHPTGDNSFKNYEQNLRNMGTSSEVAPSTQSDTKYELKEFWGYLSADKLVEQGVKGISPEQHGLEFAANIWMLGPLIVKATISKLEGFSFPFHFFYYEKDETSIWGEGVPTIMRDPQTLFNASVRALLDNAAISAGPIIEANMELLINEDPTDLYPFRVFQRGGQGVEANAKALNIYEVPSYTGELLNLAKFFGEMSDEITVIPKYMAGDSSNIGSAGQTASGLSMLMGAVNVNIKDQIKNFDDGITKPFIKELYFWNMEFNNSEEIKGDFQVVAKGSASLVAKELRTEQLNAFLNLTNNEYDMQYVNRDTLLREIVKLYDLDDLNLIKDPNQIAMEQAERDRQAEEDAQDAKRLEFMKAKSGGHMDDGPAAQPDTLPSELVGAAPPPQ